MAGYWYEDSGYSIGVSLNPTAADMNRAILVINLVTNFKVFLEDSSLPTDQKPFGVHNLQHTIRAAGVNKEIVV